MHAATAGCMTSLRLLSHHKENFNIQDNRKMTAIMYAVRFSQDECLALMLDKKAEVNDQSQSGQSALMLAVLCCNEVHVKMLLDYKAEVMDEDCHGNTAITLATKNHHYTCQHLLTNGAPGGQRVDLRSRSGTRKANGDVAETKPAWIKAAWSCDVHAMSDMVERKFNINGKDNYGWTAVMIAVIRNDPYCLDFLMQSDADINAQDSNGWTAVMLAAKKGHVESLEMLIEAQADVQQKNNNDQTALDAAAQAGCKHCLKALIKIVGEVSKPHWTEPSPAVTYLLTTGHLFKTKSWNSDGQAATAGDDDEDLDEADEAAGKKKQMKKSGTMKPGSKNSPTAASEVIDENPVPELWFNAAYYNRTDVLEELCDQGDWVDAFANSGQTALMISCELGHDASVKFLVSKDASVDLRDRHYGKTALAFAASEGHVGCIQILYKEGEANVTERDNDRRTALMMAAFGGHLSVVRYLCRIGADLDAKDAEGLTPSLIAATRGKVDCLQVLAQSGAELVIKSQTGDSSNVLHKLEKVMNTKAAAGCVAASDWQHAVPGGTEGMEEAVTLAEKDKIDHKYQVAGLHFALWKEAPDGSLKVRNTSFCESLLGCVVEFLDQSKTQKLTNVGKKALAISLEAGILRAISGEDAIELKEINKGVLKELENVLEERQKALSLVSQMTPAVDVFFPRWNRNKEKVQTKLDQRDSMPGATWQWIENLPSDCFERLQVAYKAFSGIGRVHSEQQFATYLRSHDFLCDNSLYAKCGAHMLVGWADVVQPFFDDFMREHFGSTYHGAPNKKLPRMYTKMGGDFPDLHDETKTSEDSTLRCTYFQLGDIVRGAITAQGPDDLIEIVDKLQKLSTMGEIGKFEAWRIKNTHHHSASEVVGGYRDVKVLGCFTAARKRMGFKVSQIVEIQVIDVVFTEIKKFMHKAYAIDRGDFDAQAKHVGEVDNGAGTGD